jgi:RNA polymerase sigma-70 factor (ECF subfamily)
VTGSVSGALERTFREEQGRIIASLIRALGDFDLAEDAVQEALAVALERWPADGIPANPAAWITTACAGGRWGPRSTPGSKRNARPPRRGWT